MPKQKTKEEEMLSIIKDWREMADKYSVRAAKQMNKIARLEVWRWYSSYAPREYNRKKTLYYAFKITGGNGIVNVHFGPEMMYPIHRVDKYDSSYIFENSFMQGFHGGAINGSDHPNPGIPYWRRPAPDYPEWGWPAAHNVSPYERINKAFDDYAKRTSKKLENEFKKKILPRVMRSLYL